MSWKEVLKAGCGNHEKMTCSCSSCEEERKAYCPHCDGNAGRDKCICNMEKKLVGNQKKIDADKDGKITANDFKILRE